MEAVGVTIAFGAGILSFLSPCVLPLVPSYLSFVSGMSLEELEAGVNRRAAFTHSLLFVAGFTGVFLLLGASASFLGQLLRVYESWISRAGGVLIVLLGLHLMGIFRLTPLLRERRVHLHDKPTGYMGSVGVGAVFAAGWTPCIGPILGAILTFAASREELWTGVGLLMVYSLGLAVPFLLSTLALAAFLRAFARFRRFLPFVQVLSGGILVLLGLLLLTGRFGALTAYLSRFTPGFVLERI